MRHSSVVLLDMGLRDAWYGNALLGKALMRSLVWNGLRKGQLKLFN